MLISNLELRRLIRKQTKPHRSILIISHTMILSVVAHTNGTELSYSVIWRSKNDIAGIDWGLPITCHKKFVASRHSAWW